MAAKDRDARESRERARLYQARQAYQEGRIRRRTRDNVIAGVAGGALILAVVGGQIAYFTMGPGMPEPTPSGTSTPAPTPSPTTTEAPTPEPTVTDPAATPTP